MDHRGEQVAPSGAKIRGFCPTFWKYNGYECNAWDLGFWDSIYLVNYRLVIFCKNTITVNIDC